MTNNNCNSRAEEAARETNLVKKGVAYNKASQCYKKNDEIEQYKLMKEKAIESFQKEAIKVEDPYEKSLITSYEALCWICLGELENAKALIDKNIKIYEKASNYTPPPILNFIKNLASKEVEKAEAIWKNIYQNFSEGIIELLKEAFITINPSSEPPILQKPLKISKIWKVTMAGKSREEKEDWTITFFDAKEIFGQEVILKAEFMDDLFEKLKEIKQYHFVQNVRSVLSSSGDDLSKKALYILLATSDEKNLKFGVILGQIKDGGLHVIALWPEALTQAISEDKDIFYSFINRIIKKSDWFSDMNVVTFLPDETGKNKEKKELPDEPSTLPDYYT